MSQQQALRFYIPMGNARAKTTPTQVIEISGEEVAGVIQATDVARMRAFQDFLSEDETGIDGGGPRNSGDGCRENSERNRGKSHRPCREFSDFLVVRLTCEGPASATVRAGSAWCVRIRCPISSKAQMQALAYVECIGCLGSEFRPEPAKKR